MRRQAENFGAEFVTGEVLHMELEKEIKEIKTTRGDYKALGSGPGNRSQSKENRIQRGTGVSGKRRRLLCHLRR